jgi:Phycobilisome protein
MNASDALLDYKPIIARAITDAMYREKPELLERYGETGRVRCLEDMHFNIEHLAPAVALGEPVLFARYVVWLRDMLAARNVPVDDVRRSLELTNDMVNQHLPEHAHAIVDVINAGLAALDS